MGKHDLSLPVTEDERKNRQDQAADWFRSLRDQICDAFEAIENDYAAAHPEAGVPGRFERRPWDRPEGGGGVMSLMHGLVFEKVGVNISTVHGRFSNEFKGQIPGTADNPEFWASGISLVAHMRNPFVPAVHMNTRYLNTGGAAGKRWFGGGADLTPIMPITEDTDDFHSRLKSACDAHDPEYYPQYKAWCDEYFYLPHRSLGSWNYDANGIKEWHSKQKFGGAYRNAPIMADRMQALGSWNIRAGTGSLSWYNDDNIPLATHRDKTGAPVGGNFLFEDGHVEWRNWNINNVKGTIDIGSAQGSWQLFYKIPIAEDPNRGERRR